MGTTPELSLPWPEPSAFLKDGATAIRNLAEDVETVLTPADQGGPGVYVSPGNWSLYSPFLVVAGPLVLISGIIERAGAFDLPVPADGVLAASELVLTFDIDPPNVFPTITQGIGSGPFGRDAGFHVELNTGFARLYIDRVDPAGGDVVVTDVLSFSGIYLRAM